MKFNDFILEFIVISNGIGQGDPLSMILYLFYNADFLDMPRNKDEGVLAFVDDSTLIAIAANFKSAHEKLVDMMTRHNGGYAWAKRHNLKFKTSKFAVMDFLQKQVPHPTKPRKKTLLPCLNLILNGTIIKPVESFHFLG